MTTGRTRRRMTSRNPRSPLQTSATPPNVDESRLPQRLPPLGYPATVLPNLTFHFYPGCTPRLSIFSLSHPSVHQRPLSVPTISNSSSSSLPLQSPRRLDSEGSSALAVTPHRPRPLSHHQTVSSPPSSYSLVITNLRSRLSPTNIISRQTSTTRLRLSPTLHPTPHHTTSTRTIRPTPLPAMTNPLLRTTTSSLPPPLTPLRSPRPSQVRQSKQLSTSSDRPLL
jgi:hypothetical protein